MGTETGILWTDRTWNPWQGCHRVSPGCLNCYMAREKKRYGQDPFTVVRSKPHTFNAPLSKKWAEPGKRVFVCSWSDFFIEEADAWRPEAWDIIRRSPHLTFQICTKRPERITSHLPEDWGGGWPNVWMGITAEDQERADDRIPFLLGVPSAVSFLSVEPMISPVDITRWIPSALCSWNISPIDWVIIGAESGGAARPLAMTWAGALIDQCRNAGVACFVKQLHVGGRLSLDPSDWPEDFRVREFPPSPIPEPRKAAP